MRRPLIRGVCNGHKDLFASRTLPRDPMHGRLHADVLLLRRRSGRELYPELTSSRECFGSDDNPYPFMLAQPKINTAKGRLFGLQQPVAIRDNRIIRQILATNEFRTEPQRLVNLPDVHQRDTD
jgi:hypothetical protein